jgi:TolA-binding protein
LFDFFFVNSSSLFYFTFSVLPYDVSEEARSCSPVSSSLGLVETFSPQMEEEEYMNKVRNLHVKYRTQIQELQERCRRNERTIQEMDKVAREDMQESLRLHRRIIRLERA